MKTYKSPVTYEGVKCLLKYGKRFSERHGMDEDQVLKAALELERRLNTIYATYRLTRELGARPTQERKALEEISKHLDAIRHGMDEDQVLKAADNLKKAHAAYTEAFGNFRVILEKIVSDAMENHVCSENKLEYVEGLVTSLSKEGRHDKTRNILTEQLICLYTDHSGWEPVTRNKFHDKNAYKPALNFTNDALDLLGLTDLYPDKRALEKQIPRLYALILRRK